MPKYIKPTFAITANSYDATTDAGPMSWGLTLSTTPTADASGRITVDLVDQGIETCAVDTDVVIIDGSARAEANGANADGVTGNPYVVGTMGGLVYLKNTDATNSILVGILPSARIDVDDDITSLAFDATPLAPAVAADNTSGLSEPTGKTFRTMTLKAGEFAFFPFDYTGDIVVEAASGTPKLEWWLFDRA
tara:strand:+ start:89 stop:664 length:576 start_codon:yes stop_codon:yes gene_type:complete